MAPFHAMAELKQTAQENILISQILKRFKLALVIACPAEVKSHHTWEKHVFYFA